MSRFLTTTGSIEKPERNELMREIIRFKNKKIAVNADSYFQ